MGDDGKYKEYCRQMKEKRNLTLSIPESAVSFQSESSLCSVLVKRWRSWPVARYLWPVPLSAYLKIALW